MQARLDTGSGTCSASGAGVSNPAARIPELDGVRGIAILLVLVYHYIQSILAPGRSLADDVVAQALSLTFCGVDLFFVLSGFLIGGILLRNREATNYLAVFYTRRVARLLPLYLVNFAIFLAASPILLASGSEAGSWLAKGFGAIPEWSYPLYLQNILMATHGAGGAQWLAPTWSLAIEEQFYLFAPLLIWLLPERHLPRVLVALIVSAPLLRTLLVYTHGNIIPPYVLLPCRWDSLCLGILLAWICEQPRYLAWLRANPAELLQRLWFGLAVLIAFIVLGIKAHTLPMLVIGHTVLALVACIVIVCALYVDHPIIKAIFCNPALRWLGVVSYGVYLIHMPVLGLVAHATTGAIPRYATLADVAVVLVALATTLGLAALSWRWFERPLIDMAHQVRYRQPASA